MPFLVVSGVTLLVSPSSGEREKEEIGDRARAFDGTMRQTVRARKRSWHIVTTPLTRADADAREPYLESNTLPLVCSGDLLGGTVNCFCGVIHWTPVHVPAVGHRVVLDFTLYEA